jgi:hypothetical protein
LRRFGLLFLLQRFGLLLPATWAVDFSGISCLGQAFFYDALTSSFKAGVLLFVSNKVESSEPALLTMESIFSEGKITPKSAYGLAKLWQAVLNVSYSSGKAWVFFVFTL